THYEVLAAADPTDPSRLIACSFLFPADGGRTTNVVYTSFDGGRTWEPTLGGDELLDASDPACAYGPDGEAYFVAALLTRGEPRRMKFYRSKDGGRTWGPATIFTYMDREYLAVDTTKGRYRGRIYVNGNNRADPVSDVVMFRSTDGGASFAGPARRPGFGEWSANEMGNGVVLSDGTVVLLFSETKKEAAGRGDRAANNLIRVVTSADGGETLSPATTVAERYLEGGRKSLVNSNVAPLPVLAVDRGEGPFKDRLYAAWGDQRTGRTEIWFSYSADRGRTWSPARPINDDRPRPFGGYGPDDSMPALDVNGAGVVGASWYDRRDNPDNLGWYVRFTASLDGGETFLPSVRVSSEPSVFPKADRWDLVSSITGGGDPEVRSGRKTLSVNVGLQNFTMNGGDTAGLAADASGVFHPVWVDNRTGTPQLWTAPVTVAGKAVEHGSAELSGLEDVSQKLMLENVGQPRLDESGLLTMTVRLKNTSKETLAAPLKMRLLALRSELGEPSVANADNGLDGAGATWDFTPELPGGLLAPGAATQPKTLRFRLRDLRPFQQGREFRRGFIALDAMMLGRTVR
ncbi:MAG TPA: sialidase family protein, partial [Vicinamibacteria bacterium]